MLFSLSRVNGMDAVTVSIDKNKDANAVQLSEKINRKLAELKKRFPYVKFKILEDSGKEIKKEINKLLKKASFIFLFVFLSLVIFLFSIRTPLIVILSILFSSIFTLDFFFLFDMSVNLITLTGLALGFGMIVDNSIVVGESIIDYLVEGYDRKDAVVKGTGDVIGSVFASTLTTIGAFFAFVFMSGRMSTYYLPLAYSIVIALLSSMFIAFTLIPLLFYKTNVGSKR
ncbi:multidrug ABC transporter, partial [cyanobacterium G8-9]